MRLASLAPRSLARLVVAALVLTLGVAAGSMTPAVADTAPPEGTPATVTADALPTWQVDGIVWSQAVVGNTVYATGRFSTARPPGVAVGGAGEVPAGNLIAYDIRTGERIASFDHTLNAQGLVVHASQDGTRIYVGGDFTTVDGQPRGHVAAFDVATGALVPGFAPPVDGGVRAIATNGPWVYLGGSFFNVNGVYRQRLAAVASVNGGLSPAWQPRASTSDVRSMVMAPDRSKLVVGGSFQTINGVTANGQAALDLTTGAPLPWAASTTLVDYDQGGITGLATDGTLIYGSGYAFGTGGRFEGSYAVNPADGSIVWIADCLGDVYGIYPTADSVYSVGHAHNCSNIGSFPDTNPRVRWQRAMATTKAAVGTIAKTNAYGWDFRGFGMPSVLHWFPALEMGKVSGQAQAAWSVVGTGDYVALGGEFPLVNSAPQQGLVRFATKAKAPLQTRPRFTFVPARDVPTVAAAVRPGVVRVSFGTAWDRDNALLTYDLFRDGQTTKVATTSARTSFWDAPTIGLTDPDVPAGSHTYQVRATDPDGNTNWTTVSNAVDVSRADATGYPAAVLGDGATSYWRLGESSGSIAYDWTGNGADAYATGAGVTWGTAGATNDGTTGATLSGTTTGVLASPTKVAAPQQFSVEAWFSTTTIRGGKIIGFGDATTGSSVTADRHVYMDNAGRLNFGVQSAAKTVVRSAAAFNDGRWHHVVATLGPAGMAMYVDGTLVGRDGTVTSGVDYAGRWVLGGDTVSGWANTPTSRYLAGAVDDVAVYPSVLGLADVRRHLEASGRTAAHVAAPAGPYAAAVTASSPSLYWRLDEPTGTLAVDSSDRDERGTYSGTTTRGVVGAVPGNAGVRLNGTTGLVSSAMSSVAPSAWTSELWFSSTSRTGGKLIGFGDRASGASTQTSRNVQLLADGRIRFSTGDGQHAVTSSAAYADGAWHQVVASQGPAGMALYVDGLVVGRDATTTDTPGAGFWRVGGDAVLPGSTSGYLAGSVDEVSVYPSVLSDADVKNHYVASGRTAPNSLPVASFAAVPTGSTVAVDASASTDADGPIASYAWDFGDGSTGTGVSAGHDYGRAGTFTVTLTVSDGSGATASTTRSVTVVDPDRPPTALFTATTPADLTVAVDASASSDPDGPIASYAWDFGDGTTGSGATTGHVYAGPGTYTVRLTVTDSIGTTASTSSDVVVAGPFARDTFGRSETSGLGTAEVGGAWSLSGAKSLFAVGNGVGTLRSATAGTGAAAQLAGVSSTDSDLRVTFSTSVLANGGGQFVYVTGRGGFTDAYRAKLQISSTGVLTAANTRIVAGAETTLGSAATGLTVVPGTRYAVRLQTTGSGATTMRLKVWPAADAEPASWLVTSTDGTAALQSPGGVGLRTYLSGSATNAPVTVSFDDLDVRRP